MVVVKRTKISLTAPENVHTFVFDVTIAQAIKQKPKTDSSHFTQFVSQRMLKCHRSSGLTDAKTCGGEANVLRSEATDLH